MTDFMTPQDFAAKVGWEDGIVGALDYGLKHTELDPNDPDSTDLRAAWAQLETAYNAIRPQMDRVSDLLDELEEDDEGE